MIDNSHIKGFNTDVLTDGGKTVLSGHSLVGTHSETNGGTFKTAVYQ